MNITILIKKCNCCEKNLHWRETQVGFGNCRNTKCLDSSELGYGGERIRAENVNFIKSERNLRKMLSINDYHDCIIVKLDRHIHCQKYGIVKIFLCT